MKRVRRKERNRMPFWPFPKKPKRVLINANHDILERK
jgi:hypothetical protein